MIKLAVFDLDKTLLDDEGKLPKDFLTYQNKLKQRGVQLAIATTRPWESVKKLFGDSIQNMVGVCDNGNRIFLGESYEILHIYDQKEITQLVQYVETDVDIALLLSGINHSYIDPISASRFHMHDKMWLLPDVLDIKKYVFCKDDICNVNFLCLSSKEDMDLFELVAQKINTTFQKLTVQYNLMPAGYGWIAVLPPNGGKRLGLQTLMEHLQTNLDETFVFGDSENDVPMFSLVKHSYAMQNAEESIKDKASFVTKEDNNHNGALKAILDYLEQSL